MTWTARSLIKNLTNNFMFFGSAKRQLLTWLIRPKFTPINYSLDYTVALDLTAEYPWYYQLYFCCLTRFFIWLYQTKAKLLGICTVSQIHTGNTGFDLTPPSISRLSLTTLWFKLYCDGSNQFLLSNNMKYNRFLSFTSVCASGMVQRS